MRKPTPYDIAYGWHMMALADLSYHLPISVNPLPECGWFKRRLVKDGPFVPARIWLHQEIDPETGELIADEIMRCEVNGMARDPMEQWTWLCGQPISEAEFKYMMAVRYHAGWYDPRLPQANPRQPVDWRKVPTPRFT